MKIHFLGTSCGCEPMPNRRHQSLCIEINNSIYFFDAGEACSITSHLMNINLLNVKAIFISHPHIDHIGGLLNLFWTILKLKSVNKQDITFNKIDLFVPSLYIWQSYKTLLDNAKIPFSSNVLVNATEVEDNLVYDDEYIKVTAYHNSHIKKKEDNKYTSFSYKIEAENKTLVYSGDIGHLSDLDRLLEDKCDVLFVETGHFSHKEVAQYAKDKNVGKLFIIHCGRFIINNPKKALREVRKIFGYNSFIPKDKTTIKL